MGTLEEMQEAMIKLSESKIRNIGEGFKQIGKNMSQGMLLGKALGVDAHKEEMMYAQAYQLYNMGKYNEANDLFAILVTLNPFVPDYLFGYAASLQMAKEYADAADTYVKCGHFDAENPVCFYHATECYIKLNDIRSALVTLDVVIQRCGDKPEHEAIKFRSQAMYDQLKEQLLSGEEANVEKSSEPGPELKKRQKQGE